MAIITDLALEILQEIVGILPHTRPTQDPPPTSFNSTEVGYPLKETTDRYRRIAPLRAVCRAFDDAVQPILFSEVVIDCLHTRLDVVQSQFESLSSGRGPWRRYARSLKIVNLDPCYDRRPSGGGVQYWTEYFSEEQRDNAYKMEELIQARLIPSIQTGFPNLEAVRSERIYALRHTKLTEADSWFVRRSDPVQELIGYLATVKTLKSLTLVLWNDRVIRDFPLDSFSNLCRISLFFFNDDNAKRMDDVWYRDARRLFQRLHLLVESSPELAALKIGKVYRERQRSEEDLKIPLFPLDFLLTPAAQQLCHLSLRRFDLVRADEDTIPGDYYTHLTQNLTSLTSLDLTECNYYTCPALWNAICDSNVLLSSIKVDYFTAGLVKYLHRPEVPLRVLTLVLHRFSLYEDTHWDQAGDLAVQCFTTILETHKDTLQKLDFQVMPQYLWWLEVEKPANGEARSDQQRPSQIARRIYLEDTSLLRCKELRKLSVTLDLREVEGTTEITPDTTGISRRVSKLAKEVSTLPKLEELTIYHPEQRMSAYYAQRPEIDAAIQEMVIPASESGCFSFDIVFQEARYQLVAPGFLEHDDDPSSGEYTDARGWRFVDINAEEVVPWKDPYDEEDEEDEEARARELSEFAPFDDTDSA